MVLNGKAELAAKAAKAAKCRYEQLELCGICMVLSLALVLSYQLYLSMVDGWQERPQQRWHVLMLSLSLLLTSIVTCVYLCRRLQTVRLPTYPALFCRMKPAPLDSDKPKLTAIARSCCGWEVGGGRLRRLTLVAASGIFQSLCERISRTLTSVNSQLYLITGERPPSYDTVTGADFAYVPPPPYNAVFSV